MSWKPGQPVFSRTGGIFVFCILSAALTATQACAEKGQETEMITIVALGDSTTAGTPLFFSPREMPPDGRGDPESQYSYWAMLAHPEWNILNRGVRGQRSDQIRARYDYDVSREKPSVLIVIAGVNDVYQNYPEEHVKDNLRMIYERAAADGIRVMAGTILPFDIATPEQNRKLESLNRWIREHTQAQGYGFVDTYAALEHPAYPGKLMSTDDGIHPDIAGYRLMGEAVTAALEKWLRK